MRVSRLKITNFRGIAAAELMFSGHCLMVGQNNVGKSTICEALDLVLGQDRLHKFPPLDEYDFYNAQYLTQDEEPAPCPLRIEVVLTDISPEISRLCANYLEYWHSGEQRLLGANELAAVDATSTTACLRLETVGLYDPDDDEFTADTYFAHGPLRQDGDRHRVPKSIKRRIGFIYLRTLRTGTRALTLERGSLLDVILRIQGIRTGLWEKTIARLRELNPPLEQDHPGLVASLASIEARLGSYIPLEAASSAARLFVSQLTREHLRKTIAFFVSVSEGQNPVPFSEAGTGTINTLVLALLSFIADLNPDNIIFAMEEPEIALPPHTQRRIADYLLNKTTQAFVTSHSPYVIERFKPAQITILRRTSRAEVTGAVIGDIGVLDPYTYLRHARRGLAEAMLANAVLVAEGVSEVTALSAAARILERADQSLFPLDLAGVTLFDAGGDGQMPTFGAFFKALDLRTFAFYDRKARDPAQSQQFTDSFDINCEHQYPGIERLLATEVPLPHQWTFLSTIRDSGGHPNAGIPSSQPDDTRIRTLTEAVLTSRKGAGWTSRLLEFCLPEELPSTMVAFLRQVFAQFPRPATPTVGASPVAPGNGPTTPQAGPSEPGVSTA